jgi:hypothetical protein
VKHQISAVSAIAGRAMAAKVMATVARVMRIIVNQKS